MASSLLLRRCIFGSIVQCNAIHYSTITLSPEFFFSGAISFSTLSFAPSDFFLAFSFTSSRCALSSWKIMLSRSPVRRTVYSTIASYFFRNACNSAYTDTSPEEASGCLPASMLPPSLVDGAAAGDEGACTSPALASALRDASQPIGSSPVAGAVGAAAKSD